MTFFKIFSKKTLLKWSTDQFMRRHSSTPSESKPWIYLWKPGPYPKTEAQRFAAAKKYGLHISEYATTEDMGNGLGDYPALPMIGDALKDPYYPYDFPEHRRNFQEPIHADADILCETRYDCGFRHRIPPYMQWLQLMAAISLFYILFHFGNKAPMFHSVIPKQYPRKGVHYTFEPNENVQSDELENHALL